MFTSLMSLIIKRNVLNVATTAPKLVKIDMRDNQNQLAGTALQR